MRSGASRMPGERPQPLLEPTVLVRIGSLSSMVTAAVTDDRVFLDRTRRAAATALLDSGITRASNAEDMARGIGKVSCSDARGSNQPRHDERPGEGPVVHLMRAGSWALDFEGRCSPTLVFHVAPGAAELGGARRSNRLAAAPHRHTLYTAGFVPSAPLAGTAAWSASPSPPHCRPRRIRACESSLSLLRSSWPDQASQSARKQQEPSTAASWTHRALPCPA